MAITADQLRRIVGNQLSQSRAEALVPAINAAMQEFGISSSLERACMFIAQTAHETMGYNRFVESWGPTDAQKRYEGRDDLGNTEPGDGFRYRGRGAFQLTGRANYRKYGDKLHVDLIGNPNQAAAPLYAFRIAGLYWQDHDLSRWADRGDFREVTRRINGGYNGLQDRLRYYNRAKAVLG